jgi:hypothetical protein
MLGEVAWFRLRAGNGRAAPLEATAKRMVEKDSTLTKNSVHNFLQDKLVGCDDQVATGSFNFSKSATKNAENSLILYEAAHEVQRWPGGQEGGLLEVDLFKGLHEVWLRFGNFAWIALDVRFLFA